MNSRRFRYTFLSVISELGMSDGRLISMWISLWTPERRSPLHRGANDPHYIETRAPVAPMDVHGAPGRGESASTAERRRNTGQSTRDAGRFGRSTRPAPNAVPTSPRASV